MEMQGAIRVNEWLSSNGISEAKFISFVRHKENHSAYGSVFLTDKGLVFFKHKWTEINKNRPAPRVCAEMQYTGKFADETIWNAFEKIGKDDYLVEEYVDMVQTEKKNYPG